MIDMQSTYCEGGWLQKTPRVQTPEFVELRKQVAEDVISVGHDDVPFHHILTSCEQWAWDAGTTYIAIHECICPQNALYIEKRSLLSGLYLSRAMSVTA